MGSGRGWRLLRCRGRPIHFFLDRFWHSRLPAATIGSDYQHKKRETKSGEDNTLALIERDHRQKAKEMTKNTTWAIYSTFGNAEEAFSVANSLLEKRLIACANVIDQVTSIYRWQGGIQREKEVVMIAKTSENRVEEAITILAELHSYQLPAITAYPIMAGFPAFLQWVADETAIA